MKWLAPVVVVALAVLAEVTLGRLGGAPDFALFFGRFHPLIVHLPIGFFLLVALAEAATFHPKLRERVEPALGLLVPVSALAALAAFLMGQLLALEGGFPAGALGWHRRLTLLAVIGMAGCWVLFERQHDQAARGGDATQLRWAYRGAMGLTLGLLSLGAHFGGTMTRGESYLSKYAPGPLKPLLGAPEAKKEAPKPGPAAATAEPLVYQDVVQPLLTKYCVDCHGAEKQKGKLRVDSLELLMQGGEDGPVVVAGAAAKSSLVGRMLLPVSDDDHMPPKDEPSPPPEAIALIQFWIERGASPTLKVRDALPPAASRALLEHTLGIAPATDAVPVSAPGAPAPSAAPAASSPASTPAAVPSSAAAPRSTSEPTPDKPSSSSATPTTATAETSPAAVAPAPATSSGPAFLATYCEKCHGAAKQKGKLRVDSIAALVKGGASGTALVPGIPDKSSVVQRVRLALGDEDHMPPKKEPQPSAAEVAALAAWVRAGAGSGSASASVAKTPSGSPPTAATATAATAATAAATAAATPAVTAPDTAPASTATSAADTAAAAPAPASSAPPADVSGTPDPALLESLPPKVALFSAAIAPLFREKCGKCHIKSEPAGGLGVEQHAQLLEGGFSGAGIVPKNRKDSVVMQRLILPASDSDHMPPIEEPQLSADEVELVGAWIDQGAPAQGATETAQLTLGAARALSAHGVKAGPTPPAVQAGGCAACSVPGAPQSKWLGLQALALVGAATILAARRHQRRVAQSLLAGRS